MHRRQQHLKLRRRSRSRRWPLADAARSRVHSPAPGAGHLRGVLAHHAVADRALVGHRDAVPTRTASLSCCSAAVAVWRDRAAIAAVPGAAFLRSRPSRSPRLASAWLVAYRAGLQIVHQALLPMICHGRAAPIFGVRACCAALASARPICTSRSRSGTRLLPLLQWISVFAVRVPAARGGHPGVLRSNNEFQIPAGTFRDRRRLQRPAFLHRRR